MKAVIPGILYTGIRLETGEPPPELSELYLLFVDTRGNNFKSPILAFLTVPDPPLADPLEDLLDLLDPLDYLLDPLDDLLDPLDDLLDALDPSDETLVLPGAAAGKLPLSLS